MKQQRHSDAVLMHTHPHLKVGRKEWIAVRHYHRVYLEEQVCDDYG